jgi:hypothetical protein
LQFQENTCAVLTLQNASRLCQDIATVRRWNSALNFRSMHQSETLETLMVAIVHVHELLNRQPVLPIC